MPRVSFTSHVARHVACPPESVEGATIRDALEAYFTVHPKVRAYVFDEQGELRKHVVVFANEEMARDRRHLSDGVSAETEIFVMQALSGG